MKSLTIKKEDAVLVAIDFQEKLLPSMSGCEHLSEIAVKLVKGCRILGVPVIATQQYTKGLGVTTRPITEALTMAIGENVQQALFEPIEKTAFSAMREPAFVAALKKTNRTSVIICGIEAHVCVQQTALDLLEAGYDVFAVIDCMASRTEQNKEYGQVRMAQAGVMVTGYESILFELLSDAKAEGFKQISAIVK